MKLPVISTIDEGALAVILWLVSLNYFSMYA